MSSEQIKLNEFYPSPASGETEWLEIYNAGEETVTVHDWTVMDASGNKESLRKESDEASASSEIRLEPKSFFVLETSKVSLNNTGDTIYLYSPTGILMDSVTYPSLSKKSYARKTDGTGEWQVTTNITKGIGNVVASTVETKITETTDEEIYNYNLAALEFYPCPSTGETEWLRLQNQGTQAVNLLGFKIKNGASSVSRNLSDVTLNAGASAKIEFASGVAPNSGGSLLLLDPAGETVVEIVYAACSAKSVTFNLIDGKWQEKTVVETSQSTEETVVESEETIANSSSNKTKDQTKIWSDGESFAAPRYQYGEKKGEEKVKSESGAASESAILDTDLKEEKGLNLTNWQKVGLISVAIIVIIMSTIIIGVITYRLWREKNEGKNGNKEEKDNFNLADY